MKTWLLILVLAIGTVLMKTIGPVLPGVGNHPRPSPESSLWLLRR